MTPATPDYTMGFSDEMLESLRRYTAEASAAYLLPSLRPGFRVLDFGCGPGTITAGLARAAAPGEVHSVDRIRDAYDRWRGEPGAFCALAFREVVAGKS